MIGAGDFGPGCAELQDSVLKVLGILVPDTNNPIITGQGKYTGHFLHHEIIPHKPPAFDDNLGIGVNQQIHQYIDQVGGLFAKLPVQALLFLILIHRRGLFQNMSKERIQLLKLDLTQLQLLPISTLT